MLARPALVSVLLVALALGGGAALASQVDVTQNETGAASVIEPAVVESIPHIRRSFADFIRPTDPTAEPVDVDGPRLDGVDAITMSLGDGGFTGLESMDQLTGPAGAYLDRIGFDSWDAGLVDYYTTRPDATLYLARFTGMPQAPADGVLGISLAWSWAGEQGLSSSPFPSDPMLGYAHNAEEGTVAGAPFRSLRSVTDGAWVEYQPPLVTFAGPVVRDQTWFFGWVVPGVPDKAAATLSYASDPTDPTALVMQQIEFGTPAMLNLPGLDLQYSDLTATQQADLENQWVVAAGDATTATTVPAATTTLTTVPVEDDVPDGDGETVVIEEQSWFERLRIWIGLGALLIGGGVLGWLRGWFGGSDTDDGPVLVDWGGPPGSEFDIADLSDTAPDDGSDWPTFRREYAELRRPQTKVLLDVHRRAGGEVLDGEWIAPTNRQISDSWLVGDNIDTSDKWSGIFVNIHTLEWIHAPDPLFDELQDRFKRPPATDMDGPVVPS